MNLPELLSKVPCLKGHYDEKTGEPTLGKGVVCLTQLLIKELTCSYRTFDSDETKAVEAIRTVLGIAQIVNEVRHELIAALKSITEDQELKQAQAALADARAHGTIAWEEIKAALGLDAKPGYVVDGYDTRAKVFTYDGAPLRHLTPNQIRYSSSIGKLLEGGKFVCHRCALVYDLVAEEAVSVYPVNIIPYSQQCHECGKMLVEGWDCQLYDAPKSKWAVIVKDELGLPRLTDVILLSDNPDDAVYEVLQRDPKCPVIGVVAVEGGE